jgi:hypothetical protein
MRRGKLAAAGLGRRSPLVGVGNTGEDELREIGTGICCCWLLHGW